MATPNDPKTPAKQTLAASALSPLELEREQNILEKNQIFEALGLVKAKEAPKPTPPKKTASAPRTPRTPTRSSERLEDTPRKVYVAEPEPRIRKPRGTKRKAPRRLEDEYTPREIDAANALIELSMGRR